MYTPLRVYYHAASADPFFTSAKSKKLREETRRLYNQMPELQWKTVGTWSAKSKVRGEGPFIKHTEKNGQKITEPRDIANKIWKAISHNSSSTHY